ncbi:glycosyltransferase [Wolbachia endosymbiont of Diaphorina citri]|jgi:Glycosyltransferases, probably involved in cell wall biogenesis|uniref:glycosyltransferase family 2 protein n=1 Tax=unclassified Wolbachia TaxID=2640676 RepID=UPI00031DEEF9|nr:MULTISPECIES: glycosyltransferase family 2 protein [unclassified Wolbachia]QJT94608.1 glycosyltransferase [Wolbachia endosymbiont of Diaphorina citri]QJT95847.1 glycosyltransferase [Wolbachia endosymbiont of Diaphorina citri]QJT97209.1 glycosyltransferase [Wolbachia endosymbiont of Diaphorina citri]QLK11506.1 glycosyltransferase [Wolbachia endosymbiont of Diaphorina citri]QXY86959.1 glycosyltransferase [Wolbachia endosymbiont of Diaphorina citri]
MPVLQTDNVEKIKFDSSLCKEQEKLFYYRFNIIPWQKLNDTTFFMVEDISQDINLWVESHYGIEYVLIKVDSKQILNLLNSHFGISEFASNYLYYKNPNFSAKSIRLSSIFFSSFFVMISTLTLTKKYAYFALVLIFIIGCSSSLFKFVTKIFGLRKISNQKADYDKMNEPIYTILLPAFKENAVIKQLIKSIESLDYPKSKLDVKLVIESDDQEMLAAIEKCTLPQYFEVIKVPHSLPKTKAKSCNYAMSFARGKYVVIYDADDKPDPLQLKKALIEFNKGDEKLACVQAKLNYYNFGCNFLTKFFSLEYMNWFQYFLPGFQKMNMPIPLGGSSNHFSVEILKKVLFWDAYNVTEDADLGLRLAQMGYKTRIIDSETLEESPTTVFAWIKQRARWIKGYMQTYIVHLKNIKLLFKHTGLKGILLLNLFVGSSALMFFMTPFLLLSLVLTQILNELFLYYFIIVYGINLIFLIIAIRQQKMPFYFYIVSIFFPVYSLLHSVAAFLALWEFVIHPQQWNKTQHGLWKQNL